MLIVALFGSNIAGSLFNVFYNWVLIVEGVLNGPQKAAFRSVALPLYNLLAYPCCLALTLYLIWPLMTCRRRLASGEAVSPPLKNPPSQSSLSIRNQTVESGAKSLP